MDFHYLDTREDVKDMDQRVRDLYPAYADDARDLINDYLRRYDRHRWRVFNGEAADRYHDLDLIEMAYTYIAFLLDSREDSRKTGGPQLTDDWLDSGIRACLKLPFKVIDGGQDKISI